MTPPSTYLIYPEIEAKTEPHALNPSSPALSALPQQSTLPLLAATKLFTLLAGAINDLTGRVQTEPSKPDVAKQMPSLEMAPTLSEPPSPSAKNPTQTIKQLAHQQGVQQTPVNHRHTPPKQVDGRVQTQITPHARDACQKMIEEDKRGKEKSSVSADLTVPLSQDKDQLPFAFIVPYTSSFKFEDRFVRYKRKKDPREEILEELEEREREEDEEKFLDDPE